MSVPASDDRCLIEDETSLSESWLVSRLRVGCNCSDLVDLNRFATVHCMPFPFVHHPLVQAFYCLLFTTIILLAVLGNFTVIWIILRHGRMRTKTNYYLLNLSIADASISIFNTGFSWTFNLYYYWPFGETYCAINNLMGITPICVSVFTMVFMSCDRYLAIVHPLRRRTSRRATVCIICLIWVLAGLCGLPALLASKLEVNFFVEPSTDLVFKDPVCLADNFFDGSSLDSFYFKLYNHMLTSIQYIIPLFVLIFTYGRVAMVLRRKETIGDTRHQDSVNSKRKVANMLALVVGLFMVLWLPYNLYFSVLSGYVAEHMDRRTALYLYLNIYWLGMSSTIYNPIIYYYMNDRFRLGFRYAFRWLPCIRVNRDQYEVQLCTGSRASLATSRIVTLPSLHHQTPVNV